MMLRVDTERDVGDALNQLDRPSQQSRFVGERDPGVDVEHVCSRLDLGDGVGLDPAEVALFHLGRQELAAGRVDAFADHHEGTIEADDDLLGG